MKTLLTALVAILGAGAPGANAAGPLADYHWRNRILLLYVPGPDAPARAAWRDAVQARRCAIDDRDLLVGEVMGTDSGALGERAFEPHEIRALRARHGVAPDRVATVLIGKDGGVKLDVEGVADLERVFQRIDGMPMRRREMNERGDNPCG